MKTKILAITAALMAGICCGGCGRDTRVNSDPGPGGPSPADTGKPVTGAAETSKGGASGAASSSPSTGTDSTGRPSDASGGTTGADAAGSSRATDVEPRPAKRQ